MTRYDPHPQAHDDARSTPSGFTTGPSAAQNGSGVPEGGGGLREALEALADDYQRRGFFSKADDLRAVLAAHATEATEAPEPSWAMVEEVAGLIDGEWQCCPDDEPVDISHAVAHRIAQTLADAGWLADPADPPAAPEPSGDERDRARARVADLEAEVRVQRTEKWRVIGAMREDLDKAEAEVGRLRALIEHWQGEYGIVCAQRLDAEARARRAEDALRHLRDLAEVARRTDRDVHGACEGHAVCDLVAAALSAADQTSDATPSDTATEGA